MKKLLLTIFTILTTICASAQFSAITTINSVEDEAGETTYNITDKLGIGYHLNENFMIGVTQDGEDNYELLGRYMLNSIVSIPSINGLWGTCVYNHIKDSESDAMDNLDIGIGYSIKIWKGLYADPNYTMPIKEDADGNREGNFNLSISYRF